jgi:hypothetical protein
MNDFSSEEYWKAIILYGLNASTYKIAFGKTLLALCDQRKNKVSWETLSKEFLNQYQIRLGVENPMPQLDNSSRKTVMERVVESMQFNLSLDQAIAEVGKSAFGDVIHRFDNLAGIDDVKGMFYRFEDGKYIELTDELFLIHANHLSEVEEELNARWSLLEGAFSMVGHDYQLSNDIRSIYLQNATERKNLTTQIPFLQGYQGNVCFYCGESLHNTTTHVDHVLPRQVLLHDEIWNLVLSHDHCNQSKLDAIVGLYYIEKLHRRNENIMRSNHPWKKKIEFALGASDEKRKSKLLWHYENVKNVIGHTHYWGGVKNYNPEVDPFYRKFISQASVKTRQSVSVKNRSFNSQDSFDF